MALLLHRGRVPREQWGSIGELVVLALESSVSGFGKSEARKPPQDTFWLWRWVRLCCGTRSPRTRKDVWTQRIRIRDLREGIVVVGEDEEEEEEKVERKLDELEASNSTLEQWMEAEVDEKGLEDEKVSGDRKWQIQHSFTDMTLRDLEQEGHWVDHR